MPLQVNTRLGPYVVESAIGAGGMGEVYKARDTRLDRTVALKVLPASLAADPQFRERFDREARSISALNHPNICTLYDVGQQDGVDFIVMECLEGETLAARLQRGAVPLTEALKIAIDIARALDAAHRQGIVHRDLKPGNVMLTRTGAKLLDFGLAKQGPESALSVGGATALPTMAAPLTAQGTILGTFQYMAPEQLEGLDADARTDIFAFGAVVYEMVTGTRAFQGATSVSLIGAILKDQPAPMSAAQAITPPALDWVVQKCLAKKPDDRWQSAADLVSQLEWIAQGGSGVVAAPPVAKPSRRPQFLAWGIAAAMALAAATLAALHYGRQPAPTGSIRFQVSPPPDMVFIQGVVAQAVSPDGQRIAFAVSLSGQPMLGVRSLDSLQPRMLAGTEGGVLPFWSPDSRSIGFFTPGKLKKIDVAGGPPQVLCDTANVVYGGTWNRDDTIVFSSTGLWRVAAAGGAPAELTTPSAALKEQWHRWPSFLPDGHHFLYVAGPPTTVYAGDLDGHAPVRLLTSDSKAEYSDGYLLFDRQSTLLAQRFDPSALKMMGDSFPVAETVGTAIGAAAGGFSASASGVLAYRTGTNAVYAQLTWMDRTGRQIGTIGPPGDYRGLELSPDGRRIVTHAHNDVGGDIWVIDVARGTNSRFTFDANRHYAEAHWSRDGSQVAYAAAGGKPEMLVKASGGAGREEALTGLDGTNLGPQSWSPDGQLILYGRYDTKTQNDVWALPLSGDRKPIPVLTSPFSELNATFSADGRWIAYQSNETGRYEIYVQSYPSSGGKWQVSTAGGGQPRWRDDGRELFYLDGTRRLMSVPIEVEGSNFKPGVPKALFDSHAALTGGLGNIFVPYTVTKDGQRFVVGAAIKDTEVVPMTIVVNWMAGLKK